MKTKEEIKDMLIQKIILFEKQGKIDETNDYDVSDTSLILGYQITMLKWVLDIKEEW